MSYSYIRETESERLERENAQMRAVIEQQKEVIEQLRLAYADSVIKVGEQSALIEKLAVALEEAGTYNTWEARLCCATLIDKPHEDYCQIKQALQQYELWKESK